MHRRALLRSAFFSIWLSVLASAQQTVGTGTSQPAAQSPSMRQSAMGLLEEVLAGTGSLALPANRLAIEVRAFPVVWSRSDARARALVQQMASEFAEAVRTLTSDPDQNPLAALNVLRGQRNGIAKGIATTDPELALLFVTGTLPCLKTISPNDDAADHALIVDLAAQIALHDPHRALQLAEQQLKGTDDLPPSMIDLLDQVQRNDSQVGANLFRDIVDHLRHQNLSEDTQALSFSAALLGSQFSRQSETGSADSTLRSLADLVAGSALSSDVMQNEPYLLNDATDALTALVPSKRAALFPRNLQSGQVFRVQPSFSQEFNQALANGNDDQIFALLSHAPEENSENMMMRAAWTFAGNGDLEHARQVAQSLEPWQRNGVLQTAIQAAALAAGSRADFAAARQLATQVTDEDARATLLSDLAIFANGSGKSGIAEEMLGEAASLVANHNAGTSAFAAQLRVAQVYLRVKPAQAIPLLERSAGQIEQALLAASQLDGFLPDRHSFEDGELMLNQGFLYNSLLEPYAVAAADLASIDLPAARTLANRLPLPEARLMTEVFVASGVLGQKDQTQAASTNSNGLRVWLEDE